MSRNNRNAGSNGRIIQLEEENALMERKLGMLKQAMSEERERRQSLKAASPAGGFWRNSGKGTADVRKGKPVSSARGSSSSSRQKPVPAQETQQKQKQQIAGGSGPRTIPRSGAKPLTAGPNAAGGGSKQQGDDGASQRAAAELAGLQGKKQPLNRPTNAQPEPETGMSCGTDDRPGQGVVETAFDGEVDEAANRREFLEALAAWRKGGSSDMKQSANGGSGTESSSSSAVAPAKAASMTEGAETGTGTETVIPKQKPTGPYFDKLMREAQARAAGEAAALKVGCRSAAAES